MTARVELRFRDLDAFGHVYHADYLTFLDELRTAWFDDVLRLDDPGSYVVARVEIDYVSSLTAADTSVTGSVGVERTGTSSLTLRERATGASRPLTECERATATRAEVPSGPT